MASGNPARGSARFSVALPEREEVELRVYNVKGGVVKELARDVRQPGYHIIGWDGRDQQGRPVAAGIYFVHLRAGAFDRTMRVTMMR
jgi:flagellar hook assembly protein FlgD